MSEQTIIDDNRLITETNAVVVKRIGQGLPGPGRPKGSRNKLAESFHDDLYADWKQHGAEAIKAMRHKNPGEYVKLVAYVLPKDVLFNPSAISTMSPEDIAETLVNLKAALVEAASGAHTAESDGPALDTGADQTPVSEPE